MLNHIPNISSKQLQLLENIAELSITFSTDLNILAASDLLLTCVQLQRSTLVGKNLEDFIQENTPKLHVWPFLKGLLLEVLYTKKSLKAGLQDKLLFESSTLIHEGNYWLPAVIPVPDEKGEIELLLLRIENLSQEILTIKDQSRLTIEKYQTIFNSMDEGFCLLELIFDAQQNPVDFRYIEYNALFQRVTGLKDMVGKTVKEVFPGVDPHSITQYGNVATTGESIRSDTYSRALKKWFNLHAIRIGNPENHLVALLFQDITERKEGEQLNRTNQETQTFLLKLSDQIRDQANPYEIQQKVCNMIGQYMSANRAVYCENHGDEFVIQYDYVVGLPSMVGRYPVEVFGPEKFMNFFRKGEAFVVDNVSLDPKLTEEEKAAYLQAQMISFIGVGLVKKGILKASFGIHSSVPRKWTPEEIELTLTVTERTWAAVEKAKTEEALKESEMRFRTMAEASGILITHSDHFGSPIYFNNEWQKITGRNLPDLVQKGWNDLIHPEDKECFLTAYQDAFDRKDVLKQEFRLLSLSGEYRWLFAVISPRFSTVGNFAGNIASCIDITDLKLAEKTLETKNEELLKINNDLDNFIYTASHDLKAPISNIEGLMNVLLKGLPVEIKQSQVITKITSMIELSIERFKNTIYDLTEISRLQKSSREDTSTINLQELVEEIQLDIESEIEKTNAEIITDFSKCPEIKFSEKNIRSVFYNLISNAIKYNSPDRKPKIEIKSDLVNQFYTITVKDNGLGIKHTNFEKIFYMFKRVHNHVEGSGVGLYIVKKIVENAGGKIEVESEVGLGTIFSVYLKEY